MPRGRKTAIVVHLTDTETADLTKWVRSTKIAAAYARRAQLILRLAQGMPVVEIARKTAISRNKIYKWLARWRAEGLLGLQDKPGRGKRPAGG